MDRKGKISEYRNKLDKTLALPDLMNDETVHTLVSNQLLQSLDSPLGGLFYCHFTKFLQNLASYD